MTSNIPDMKAELTIKMTETGKPVLASRYYDGSSSTQTLIEQSGNVFLLEGSSTGDRYRIVTASGDLQIIDNDGLIDVARRLENESQQGKCVQ